MRRCAQGLDKLKLHTKVPYGPLLPSNDAYPRTVDTNFIHFPPDALELVEQLLSIIPSVRPRPHPPRRAADPRPAFSP